MSRETLMLEAVLLSQWRLGNMLSSLALLSHPGMDEVKAKEVRDLIFQSRDELKSLHQQFAKRSDDNARD